MQKALRLRGYFNKNGLGRFLRKHGCVPHRVNAAKPRGWRFPRLAEARSGWEQRYGKWSWNWLDLSDWI
jgi:hypothetical protein